MVEVVITDGVGVMLYHGVVNSIVKRWINEMTATNPQILVMFKPVTNFGEMENFHGERQSWLP